MTSANLPKDQRATIARTRVRRHPERARYDESTVHAILDEAMICHVGFIDDDHPVVIPTAYARVDDHLYLHGAVANAMLGALGKGSQICITVTLLDGMVLARSAFHHSINYRSVVIFAEASEVTDAEEKRAAMDALVEHLVPGRSADARRPTDTELRATKIVRVPIDESSAKVRTGGPIDEPEDLALDVWAGHIPLELIARTPVADEQTGTRIAVPDYAASYRRKS